MCCQGRQGRARAGGACTCEPLCTRGVIEWQPPAVSSLQRGKSHLLQGVEIPDPGSQVPGPARPGSWGLPLCRADSEAGVRGHLPASHRGGIKIIHAVPAPTTRRRAGLVPCADRGTSGALQQCCRSSWPSAHPEKDGKMCPPRQWPTDHLVPRPRSLLHVSGTRLTARTPLLAVRRVFALPVSVKKKTTVPQYQD